METITRQDREILRNLARKQLEYAHSPRNAALLRQWEALAQGRREAPTVRLLFSNFTHEVITPRMQCTGEAARKIEYTLLNTLVGRELFDDDTPISFLAHLGFPLRHGGENYPGPSRERLSCGAGHGGSGGRLR